MAAMSAACGGALRSRLATNALLNILAGASSALFAFVVPALLAARISAVELSIWSIMLQTAVYTTPFTLGIQGVLSRHVALHAERRDGRGMRHTMAAALRRPRRRCGPLPGARLLVAR